MAGDATAEPDGIQLDFGGFDQRFLGISLKVASRRAFDIVSGNLSDREDSQSPEERFEWLALETVRSHELRHFHDFLLSPFGAATFRYRLGAYVNAFGAIVALGLDDVLAGANTIPIPIPAWCRADDGERARLVAGWNAVARIQGVPPHVLASLPHIDESADLSGQSRAAATDVAYMHQVVDTTSRYYARLRQLIAGPHTELQPYHVSEASALLIQGQQVWTEHGDDDATLFLSTIRSRESAAYAAPLRMLPQVLAKAGQPYDVSKASAIVAWSMLGSPAIQGLVAGSPAVRFANLCNYLIAQQPAWRERVVDQFASWDKALGSEPTLESLAESLGHDDTFAPQIERLAAEAVANNAIDEPLHFAGKVFDLMRRARRECVESFLSDPDTYVSPLGYLERGHELPAPPMMIVFVDSGIRLPSVDLETGGWNVYKGGTLRDGTDIALAITRRAPDALKSPIDHDLACDAFTQFTLADILFSEFAREFEEFELDLARDALGGRQLRLRNLPA